ncbi:MAG: YlxR family protein [Clostridia bacterium]|nr:YlxR family protein [Clostridia bacterium]
MHTPMRMCIACRQMKPKGELIKLVKIENNIELDPSQKKFGRGAYICKNEECIENAKKRKAVSRHFKMNADDSIFDDIKKELSDG